MVDFAVAFLCIEVFFAGIILTFLGFAWLLTVVGEALERWAR